MELLVAGYCSVSGVMDYLSKLWNGLRLSGAKVVSCDLVSLAVELDIAEVWPVL